MRLRAALRRLGRGKFEHLERGSTEEREMDRKKINSWSACPSSSKAAGAAAKGSRGVSMRVIYACVWGGAACVCPEQVSIAPVRVTARAGSASEERGNAQEEEPTREQNN